MIEFLPFVPVFALIASIPLFGHYLYGKNPSLAGAVIYFSVFIVVFEILAICLKISFSLRLANAAVVCLGFVCIGFIASLAFRLRPRWLSLTAGVVVSMAIAIVCFIAVVATAAIALGGGGIVYETLLPDGKVCRIEPYGNATTLGGGIDGYLSRVWFAGLEQELAKSRWEDTSEVMNYEKACAKLQSDYVRQSS